MSWDRQAIDLPDSKTGAKTIHLNAPALHLLCELSGVRPADEESPWVLRGRHSGHALVDVSHPWPGSAPARDSTVCASTGSGHEEWVRRQVDCGCESSPFGDGISLPCLMDSGDDLPFEELLVLIGVKPTRWEFSDTAAVCG